MRICRLLILTAAIILLLASIVIGEERETGNEPCAEVRHKISSINDRFPGIRETSDHQLYLGSSRGLGELAGITWYDQQHNGTMGRQIVYDPVMDVVHFVWTRLENASSTRDVAYNAYNLVSGTWYHDFGTSGGKSISLDDLWAGYTTIDITSDGAAVVAFHMDSGTGLYETVADVDSINPNGDFDFLPAAPNAPNCEGWETGESESPGEYIWPVVEWDMVDGKEVLHVVAAENVSSNGGIQTLVYYGKVDGTWPSCGMAIDSVYVISPVVRQDPTSDEVAIAWLKPIYYNDPEDPCGWSQWQNDVVVWKSSNGGVTWNRGEIENVTDYLGTNGTIENIPMAYTDLSGFYDSEGVLHLVWNTPLKGDDSCTALTATRIWHWSDEPDGCISLVYDASKPRFFHDTGAWNQSTAKMNISECDDKLYVSFTRFGAYTSSDGDTSVDASDDYFENGEIFLTASTDGGESWGKAVNVTNTQTSGCESGDCLSEHWSSMAKYSTGELHIEYIEDRDAGTFVQTEGEQTENPVKYLAYPCFIPEAYSSLIASPLELDDIILFPQEELDTAFVIFNIGNVDANFTTEINYLNGNGWITNHEPSSYSVSTGCNQEISVDVDIQSPLAEGIYDAELLYIYDNGRSLDTLTVYVEITCDDGLTAAIAADPRIGANPLSVSFADLSESSQPVAEWYWTFGDGDVSSDQNPIHEYDEIGTYDVMLRITDGVLVDSVIEYKYISVLDSTEVPDFEIHQTIVAGVWNLTSADIDGDNQTDLIWTDCNAFNHEVSVSYGMSNLNFTYPESYSITEANGTPKVGFVNGDNLLDIVVRTASRLQVFLNDDNRSFHLETNYGLEDSEGIPGLALGFFNDDAFLDVAINTVLFGGQILLGVGNGSFYAGSTLPGPFKTADVMDVNGDGFDDLITISDYETSKGDNFIKVYVNDGDGNFSESTSLNISNYATITLATGNSVADFDRNGTRDFAIVTPLIGEGESRITVVYGDGAGGISHTQKINVDGIAHVIVVCDANRDAFLDLAISNTVKDQLEVYLGVGDSILHIPVVVDWGAAEDAIYNALTVGDFDRDGNPDFASGPFAVYVGDEGPIHLAVSTLPDFPVLPDEMATTGYQGVQIAVLNPDSFFISNSGSSVAGSAYWRNDFDNEGTLDESTIDYNLEYGEYEILITPRGSEYGGPFCAGVRINGTAEAVFFKDYEQMNKSGGSRIAGDTIVFYYTHEPISSIQPPNGQKAGTRPDFDWSLLVSEEPPADSFHFQLSSRHDFPNTLIDTTILLEPSISSLVDLGIDSVFYWHVRSFYSGSWQQFSRTFAVYIEDIAVGDVDGSGGIDIDDVVYLINYIFLSGPIPNPVSLGDVECSGGVDIDDIVYLIAYIFQGGPPPADTNNDGVPDC